MTANKPIILVDSEEEDQVARNVTAWINKYPDLPDDLFKGFVQYEQLTDDEICMAVSTIQGTNITRRYILGGHEAEYQFKIIYRIQPGASSDKRLSADELLDRLGSWLSKNHPDLGESINVRRMEVAARSAVFAAYENGDEDHQILMKLTYEVL